MAFLMIGKDRAKIGQRYSKKIRELLIFELTKHVKLFPILQLAYEIWQDKLNIKIFIFIWNLWQASMRLYGSI